MSAIPWSSMLKHSRTRISTIIFRPDFSIRRHFGKMPEYPGLGLPLRHLPQRDFNIFPIGSHGNCSNSDSGLLPVREVAMMIIMDRLMDKPNWEKKIFDDEIVARWRKEALDYPDDSLWQQATGGKDPNRQIESNWATRGIKPLIGIISDGSFDFVSTIGSRSPEGELTRRSA